jgi:hypothetical protein
MVILLPYYITLQPVPGRTRMPNPMRSSRALIPDRDPAGARLAPIVYPSLGELRDWRDDAIPPIYRCARRT